MLNFTNIFRAQVIDLQRAVAQQAINAASQQQELQQLYERRQQIREKCLEAQRTKRREQDAERRKAILFSLYAEPDQKLTKLAMAAGGIPRTSTQTLLDKLLDDGLICIRPGDIRAAGKQVHYRLTTAGEKFVRRQMKSAA